LRMWTPVLVVVGFFVVAPVVWVLLFVAYVC
jgi:hypothetical protein